MADVTLDIYIISRLSHGYYARELDELGISMAQFPYIMAIIDNDGISQEKLSAKLRMGKSTTAAIVKQLEEKGLITREVDRNDRRNFCLHASGSAVALRPAIQAAVDNCNEKITAGLSEEEKREFSRLLRIVRQTTEGILGTVRSRNIKE